MSTIIALAFLAGTIYLMLTNYKKGIEFYLFSIFVAPVFNLGVIRIEFFLVSIIPVIIVSFVKKKKLYLDEINIWLIVYISVSMIATIISALKYGTLSFQGISLLGMTLRALLISVIASANLSYREIKEIFIKLVYMNLVAVMVQMLLDCSSSLFYSLYYTESMVPLQEVKNYGYFTRAYGLFPTPIFLGAFSLMCLAMLAFDKEKNKKNTITEIVCLIIGMASLTKTFILGVVVFVCLFLFRTIMRKPKRIKPLTLSILCAAVMVVFLVIYILYKSGYPIFWYLNYLKNPFASLSSRYDSTTGVLNETRQIIMDNPIIGVGYNSIRNEFTGDSFYYSVLHDAGIIGVILFIMFFAKASFRNWKLNTSFFLLFLLSLLNVSSVLFFEPIGLIILYAVVQTSYTAEKKKVLWDPSKSKT